ncbi:MAG TPA: hydrogenase maturation protease, partial [Bacteroidota bacterium]|nr:hydrogenase maturation protease [Bacteroidota bacterium]
TRLAMEHKTLIIGVGNRYRNDDGVGLFVAGKLRGCVSPSETVIECTDDGAILMESWSGFDSVVLVDAVASTKNPGTVERFDIRNTPLPPELFHCTTHAFGVAAAVELARTLNTLPPRFVLYGIACSEFGMGTELSPAVIKAADRAVDMILEEIESAAGHPAGRDGKNYGKPMNRYAFGERTL